MDINKEYFDSKFSEIKEAIDRIDMRDKEDSNMFSGIFLSHDQRISRLEKLAKGS